MSGFYVADWVDAVGSRSRGHYYTSDADQVRAEIQARGGYPIRIRFRRYAWWRHEIVNLRYRVRFLKSLAFHLGNGQSQGRALALVIESETHPSLRLRLNPALDVLRRGGTFAETLEHVRIFDRTVIAILRSGEAIGQLTQAIEAAIRHLEVRQKGRKQLKAALAMLGVDVLTALGSVFSIQWQVLPWLAGNGPQPGAPQYAEYQAAIAHGYLFNGALTWATAVAVMIVAGLLAAYRYGGGRYRLAADRLVTRLPVFRALFLHAGMADTCGIAGVMVQGKVAFHKAVQAALDATVAPSVVDYWQRVMERIDNGIDLAVALQGPILSRPEQLAMGSARNLDQLASVLLEIAQERREQAEAATGQMIALTVYITLFYILFAAALLFYVLSIQGVGLDGLLSTAGGF